MHYRGDFLQLCCSAIWTLGLGPVLVIGLDAGLESSSSVRSLRAVLEGPDHNPCDLHESRHAGARSLREAGESCCPFPAGESGGTGTREVGQSSSEGAGMSKGLVRGDPARGLPLGCCGALGKPLHQSERRCPSFYCALKDKRDHNGKATFSQGEAWLT